jgi:hypothetical protein
MKHGRLATKVFTALEIYVNKASVFFDISMNINGMCYVRTDNVFWWKYSTATSLRSCVRPGVATEIRTQHISHTRLERQCYVNQLGLVYDVTPFSLVDRNGFGGACRLSLST